MAALLDFLNQNSGALNVVFTGVVTVATTVYSVLTWKLVTETRLMREVQTEPKVVVTLESLDEAVHIARLHFQNIGQGPAFHLTFNPRVEAGNDYSSKLLAEFTKPNFFKTGLHYLGPGQKRISHYTQLHEHHEDKISTVLAFDVKYKGVTGKSYSETLIVDMSEFKGTVRLGTPHMYAIAKSLEKIEKKFEQLVGGSKRIKADIYSERDREAARRQHEEWIEEQRRASKS